MRYIYLLFAIYCFFNISGAKAQSSILLESSKDNGIFSKRDSALDINNLPSSPIILPAIGVGTRLMWIPSKSAFRVGTVVDRGNDSANSWDLDKIGVYSIAGGLNTRAIGTASVALGGSSASGDYSTALGESTAIGKFSTALGKSVAIGNYSTAIGEARAEGLYSLAGGTSSTAKGDYSFAIGLASYSAGEVSVAVGEGVTAYKYGGISFGAYNNLGDTAPNTYRNALSTDRIFQLGNGIFKPNNATVFSNALTVLRNGNIGIGNTPATLSPTERLVVDGNVSVDGFSKLGSSAPAIKVLKLTGTTAAAQGTYTSIAHGLSLSKILSVEVFVSPSATVKHGRGWTAYDGYQFDFYLESTVIQILNVSGNSSSILSKPYTVLITYEQ